MNTFKKGLILASLMGLQMNPVCHASPTETQIKSKHQLPYDLPVAVSVPFFSEWLDPASFARLNMANCNHEIRASHLRNPRFIKIEEEQKLQLEFERFLRAHSTFSVTLDHRFPQITKMAQELKDKHPEFWAQGGEKGLIYFVTEPEDRAKPYFLSAEVAQKKTYLEAAGVDKDGNPTGEPNLCAGIGTLPTETQLIALTAALQKEGNNKRNAIAGLDQTIFWGSGFSDHSEYEGCDFSHGTPSKCEGYGYPASGKVFDATHPYWHEFYFITNRYSVRCALSYPEWKDPSRSNSPKPAPAPSIFDDLGSLSVPSQFLSVFPEWE